MASCVEGHSRRKVIAQLPRNVAGALAGLEGQAVTFAELACFGREALYDGLYVVDIEGE